MNDEETYYENMVCPCGKSYKEFAPCPICDEKICMDCDDWERHHKKE